MVHNLVRKTGVPAKAYSVNDPTPRSCDLKILHSDTQFVVSLGYKIGDEQFVVLRYEGDNLIQDKNSLGSNDIHFSATDLNRLARSNRADFQTLSLTLKERCSVWYPCSCGIGLYPNDPRFYQLFTFAGAKEVRIVFDMKWLGKNFARFKSAVERRRPFRGIQNVPEFIRDYQLADWSTLDDLTPRVVPSIENAVNGPPPTYSDLPKKRLRSNDRSSTTDPHRQKRPVQNRECEPSLTERANSTASDTTVEVDLFQNAVDSAIAKRLPDAVHVYFTNNPHVLLQLLAHNSPSPSLSPTPRSFHITNAPMERSSRKPTSAPGIRTFIKIGAEAEIRRMLDQVAAQTSELNSELTAEINGTATLEIDEYVEDAKCDLTIYKNDAITNFNDECNERLDVFKERADEVKDEAVADMEARAERVLLTTWGRLSEKKRKTCCGCECHSRTECKQCELGQGRRAMSLPLLTE